MIIDIFTYSQATENAPFHLESLIEAAKCARLDGIAITDRNSTARIPEYAQIAARENFLVVYGLELETAQGRVTVFPKHIDEAFVAESWRELGERPDAEAVLDYFHARDAIVVARDVYNRGEGLKDCIFSLKDATGRGFDAIDTLSVYRRKIDNELSIEAGQVLGIPACAGSGVYDSLEDIGHCATLFANEIHDQASFVAAMRGALHWSVALRDLGDACPMGSAPRTPDDERPSYGRDDSRRNTRDYSRRDDERRGRERGNRSDDRRNRSRSHENDGSERRNRSNTPGDRSGRGNRQNRRRPR